MKRRVLVVDDDDAILEVLEMRLTAMGFDVTATGDPQRALQAVDGDRFDVALLDLRMDPMDGIALMEAIHERQARLPVLIMTAHGTIETAVEAVQRGAFDYLTKPFVRDELRGKINRALASCRWARDRERLLTVGQTLASSGIMKRILESVAQAAMEATEAERCVVFQLSEGRLVAMASAGSAPASSQDLEAAASSAMDRGVPTTLAVSGSRIVVATPLVVQRGPAGALVIEAPARMEPAEDDLELLALFSAQAAVAIRNTHELERLRSGALAALGRMATEVAHEVKNPLAGLRLYAQRLEHRLGTRDDPDGVELVRKIMSTIDHLASVVGEINAFGRPRELHRTLTSLAPLLDDCLTFAQARVETEEIEVVRVYDPACPDVEVDARELRKALLNLILNGVEALPVGGRITVSTTYLEETGTVTITIEDTGAGMNEETVSRAFDLFFTTKPHGTGLGMAVARSVVDLHGGRLTLASAPGHGTCVVVRLPIRAPAQPTASEETS